MTLGYICPLKNAGSNASHHGCGKLSLSFRTSISVYLCSFFSRMPASRRLVPRLHRAHGWDLAPKFVGTDMLLFPRFFVII